MHCKMTTHPRTRRRRSAWSAIILALASTACAVSLNDLQPIQAGILPQTCATAYQETIRGCTIADFASDSDCSLSCRSGLRSVEDDIQDNCDDVTVSSNSVLGFAQKGTLITHVCILHQITLGQTTGTTVISLMSSSSSSLSTSTSTTLKTTTSLTTSTLTPSTLPLSTTVSSVATPTILSTSTTAITTSSTPPPPSPTPVTSSAADITTTVSSSTAASTASAVAQQSSTDQVGRGSPFDTTSGSSQVSVAVWSMFIPLGGVLFALLVW